MEVLDITIHRDLDFFYPEQRDDRFCSARSAEQKVRVSLCGSVANSKQKN